MKEIMTRLVALTIASALVIAPTAYAGGPRGRRWLARSRGILWPCRVSIRLPRRLRLGMVGALGSPCSVWAPLLARWHIRMLTPPARPFIHARLPACAPAILSAAGLSMINITTPAILIRPGHEGRGSAMASGATTASQTASGSRAIAPAPRPPVSNSFRPHAIAPGSRVPSLPNFRVPSLPQTY
jgi:hypothetical protein